MDTEELYQELLLDHFRHPRGKGCIEHPDGECTLKNPLCGDVVSVTLQVKDNIIQNVLFNGQGCSISQASASMMTELCKGESLDSVKEASEKFHKMMSQGLSAEEEKTLGDAAALHGVRKFSARIRCALLAWEALDKALTQSGAKK